MLCKNEIRIIEELIKNIKEENTISDISRKLNQKYPQTFRDIKILFKKGVIDIKTIGKSKIAKLDFKKYHPEYSQAEIERTNKIKNKEIEIILNKILSINKQFIGILFGSNAEGTAKKDSDIDLLFIIPDEYNQENFERILKNTLSLHNADINIIKEDSLFEMWAHPDKLNVGNEILKNHIVLTGAEYFISLLRKHYAGR